MNLVLLLAEFLSREKEHTLTIFWEQWDGRKDRTNEI